MPTATKIALITGANKGIGLEVARQLGQAGFLVLVGARDLTKGAAAAATLAAEGLQAETIALDVTDLATITLAAETITRKYGQLDILVNNASIASPGAPSIAAREGLERTFATNFFGAVAVAQAMLPLLRKAPAPRIVNVSSGLGSIALNGDPTWPYAAIKPLAYSASKAALNMFMRSFAARHAGSKRAMVLMAPGWVRTDLGGEGGRLSIEESVPSLVNVLLGKVGTPGLQYVDYLGRTVPW